MEVNKKKAGTINRMFFKYFFGFAFAIVFFIVFMVIAIVFAFETELVLPANYTDVRISEMEKDLRTSFKQEDLPPYCTYLYMDHEGNALNYNMTENDISQVKTYLKDGYKPYYDSYKVIEQYSGNILILKYDVLVHFKDSILDRVLPAPEATIVVLLLVYIIIVTMIMAYRFSIKIKDNLQPIVIATEKIREKDLEFEVVPTKIKELNDVLESIDQLKKALSTSLREQWDSEQQRKTQLAALTHDIKTPLTIIKGNTELMAEGEYSTEDKELFSYIQSSVGTIEKYLELLMEAVNSQSISVHKESVLLENLIHEVTIEAESLCNTKNLRFQVCDTSRSSHIMADSELLVRALMNIIDNSVNYSDKRDEVDLKNDTCSQTLKSDILLTISEDDNNVFFSITDHGKGFSEESLEKATQEFYTEETSRTNHHYGLGLSFVKNVVSLHEGQFIMKNQQSGGAEVTISIEK